ncbi:MAG: putative lipopolysaccharide heptosyltransferase III [Verrucomicrobia bacterium]|nr:putative lipopolysaccharide heptosyltransferase III [Verrucomicrobiota bacterium]
MTYGNYPDLSVVKRALVIKMRHHGDVLLTAPLFSNLKKALPQAEVDAFIYKDTLPMLEGHPGISDFLLYDRGWKKLSFLKKAAKEAGLLKMVRSKGYDLVINLTEGDRGAIAAMVSGAQFRVGFDPKGSGLFGKKRAFTHVVKNCPHPRHTVERQLDVLRRIGIFPAPEERDLFIHIPGDSRRKMEDMLEKEEIRPNGYILIHPVSRWKFKCLATKQIARLISALSERGLRIVMSAGPDAEEIAMVQEILSLAPEVSVLNCAGKLSLKELTALIAMSRALICVDSVPLHIASATKTPVVVMFGPTSDQNWGPWMHPKARVVAQKMTCRPCYQDGCGGSKMSDCLFSIPQNAILSALDEVLSERTQFAII